MAARSTTTPSRWPSAPLRPTPSSTPMALAQSQRAGRPACAGLEGALHGVAARVLCDRVGLDDQRPPRGRSRAQLPVISPRPTGAGGSCSSTTSWRPASTSRPRLPRPDDGRDRRRHGTLPRGRRAVLRAAARPHLIAVSRRPSTSPSPRPAGWRWRPKVSPTAALPAASTAATCTACSTASGVIQVDSRERARAQPGTALFARLGPHPHAAAQRPRRRRAVRVLGPHGGDRAERPAPTVPLADGVRSPVGRREELRAATPGLPSTRVLDRIREGGPITAADLQQRTGPKGSWWSWDDGKLALEFLFHHGRLRDRAAQRLRPPLRPAGTVPACWRLRRRPRPRPAPSCWPRRPLARRGDVGGPDRLPPSRHSGLQAARRRARRRGRPAARPGRGLAKPACMHRDATIPAR